MQVRFRLLISAAAAMFALGLTQPALADRVPAEAMDGQQELAYPRRDAKIETPSVAFAQSAFGVSVKGAGAQVYAGTVGDESDGARGVGGATVFGSPLEALLLSATTDRGFEGGWAPSAMIAYRFAGTMRDGWALAAMARYKLEGFDEAGGEIETGVLFSVGALARLHLDVNAIAGAGLDEREREGDAELKLRLGYDALRWLRLGADGQARARVLGDRPTGNGRSWDAVGGAQALANLENFYVALTVGPSTVGVRDGFGWMALFTLGGVTL